jgi:hypothetical protein
LKKKKIKILLRVITIRKIGIIVQQKEERDPQNTMLKQKKFIRHTSELNFVFDFQLTVKRYRNA